MKKLFLLILLLTFSSPVFKAFCQEELVEEEAQTISKAEQKKLAKEASKQKKTTTQKGSTTNNSGAKTTNVKGTASKSIKDEVAPNPNVKGNTVKSSSKNKPEPIAPVIEEEEDAQPKTSPNIVGGERVYIIPNKSTNPPTTEKLDSLAQGNLNLYRPLKDTDWVAEKNQRQVNDYKVGLDPYPAKPRNMWELCLNLGIPSISGDVQTWYRFGKTNGFGFTARKSIGYVTSIRFQYNQGTTYGIGWKGVNNYTYNNAVNGYYDSLVNYFSPNIKNPGKVIYLNYKNTYKALYGQLVFNLNNIKFHKERTKFIAYGVIGGGPLFYTTKINQLDIDGKMYDYSSVSISVDHNNRKNRKNELRALWDDTYESYGEQDNTFIHSKKAVKDKIYKWRGDMTVCAGLGLSIRLTRRWTLNFESLQTFTFDDLLDGQRWQELPALSSNSDNLNFSSVSINYNIGKHSSEPLWWLNPIDNQLVVLAEAKNKLAKIPEFTDSDDDGVIDFLDREPNTPEGCRVDTHGVLLDSDKDGVADCRDKEPYSVPGAKVDADGIGEKKNSDMDTLLARIRDLIANGSSSNATFPGWYLPMVHFDLDKDYIKPDFYPDMFHIAQVMKMYPQMKVYVDGHTDIRHSNTYNDNLSLRRAENSKNFIIKNYGIDPERLIVRHLGKSTNMVRDLPDHYDPRFEREQYINRRVEFTVVPESMQPQTSLSDFKQSQE